jgi:hypothetical protein
MESTTTLRITAYASRKAEANLPTGIANWMCAAGPEEEEEEAVGAGADEAAAAESEGIANFPAYGRSDMLRRKGEAMGDMLQCTKANQSHEDAIPLLFEWLVNLCHLL